MGPRMATEAGKHAARDGAHHSEQLRDKLQLAIGPALAASRRFWAHARFPDLYPEFLVRTHCIIRASVPLMEAALARARAMSASDGVARELAAYFAEHSVEEHRHDEWLLDDLQVLGMPREQVLARIPPPTVAALVGVQYYWILHYHPVALLGYVAVLEGYPPSTEHLEAVLARTGLPRAAFRTLLKHAQLDRHHRDDLDRTLDRLPLSREQSAVIGMSAFHTLELLRRNVEEVLESTVV